MVAYSNRSLHDTCFDERNIGFLERAIEEITVEIEESNRSNSHLEEEVDFSKIKDWVDDFLGSHDVSVPKVRKRPLFEMNGSYRLTIAAAQLYQWGRNLVSGFPEPGEEYSFPDAFLCFVPLKEKDRIKERFRRNANKMTYKHLEMLISLPWLLQPHIAPILAHEYTHHVQLNREEKKVEQMDRREYSRHLTNKKIFNEGHACGVEKHFVRAMRLDSGRYTLYRTQKGLYGVYGEICKRIDRMPRIKTVVPEQTTDVSDNYHSMGIALFTIAEIKKGPQIYKDAMNGIDIFAAF